MIRIIDEPRARTRRRTFHYVLEEGFLRHVSKYAVSHMVIGDEKAQKVEYYIPESAVLGKYIYRFTFTNSGSFLTPYKALVRGTLDEFNWIPISEEELRELCFEIESRDVKNLLIERDAYYVPMLREIEEFRDRFHLEIVASQRVMDFMRDVKWGELSCLCHYPESQRKGCLEEVFKLIHQWWILKLIHEALGVREIENNVWFSEQGQRRPVSIFVNDKGAYYTCWFEPQYVGEAPEDYKGPYTPIFGEKTVWKRPDLIVVKGKYKSLDDVENIDVLVECKNLEFRAWWKSGKVMREEIRPYYKIFKPRILIIASMKPVPAFFKRVLENRGFCVIDGLYPRGYGVASFLEIIRRILY